MMVKPTLNSAEEKQAIDIDAFFSGLDPLSPEPAGQYCPQSSLEPMLLARHPWAWQRCAIQTELGSFEQDEDGVTAVIRDREPGRDSDRPGRAILIAADGVHSGIRESLGVTTSGWGALPIFVVFIYFRGPLAAVCPASERRRRRPGQEIQMWTAYSWWPRDDLGMFLTTYFPDRGETAAQFTSQHCSEVLDQSRRRTDRSSRSSRLRHGSHTSRWPTNSSSGRVSRRQQSRHTMPPFKAGGASTTMQSAHNLAWKLAAVLGRRRRANESLLASFRAERHPVGRFAARQSLTGPTVALIDRDDQKARDYRRRRRRRCSPCWSATNTAPAAVVSDQPRA